MPLQVQVKILRLLQEQRFERVGGNKSISTHVRVLAATNQNLEQLIVTGRFRSDLYYRLKVVTIHVPPLRSRKEDIPELAHHFLFKYAREAGRDLQGLSSEALDLLQQYDWPGNVRELQNAMQAAAYQASGRILLPADLPSLTTFDSSVAVAIPSSDVTPTFNLTATIEKMLRDGEQEVHARVMALVERELFVRALRYTRGNQSQASELLGIYRSTLRNKLKDLGIALNKVVADRVDQSEG